MDNQSHLFEDSCQTKSSTNLKLNIIVQSPTMEQLRLSIGKPDVFALDCSKGGLEQHWNLQGQGIKIFTNKIDNH